DHVDRDRSSELAGLALDDGEKRTRPIAPGGLSCEHILARVPLGVWTRDLVDPTSDLGLVAHGRDRRDIVQRPGPQRHDPVGKGRVGRTQIHAATVQAAAKAMRAYDTSARPATAGSRFLGDREGDLAWQRRLERKDVLISASTASTPPVASISIRRRRFCT